jgi:hypothetical protein
MKTGSFGHKAQIFPTSDIITGAVMLLKLFARHAKTDYGLPTTEGLSVVRSQ